MFKFGFLFAYYISFVLYGSLAEPGGNTRTVCLLDDPSDQFYSTGLRSTLDHIALQEIRRTLSKEGAWKKDYESKLDRLELGLNRIEKQLTDIIDKLKPSLESKEDAWNKGFVSWRDGNKPLFSDIPNKLNEVPKKFEQIGSRYFYIENSLIKNWSSAEIACQQMGGHLASFRNSEEFEAVLSKRDLTHNYWLGITDRGNRGTYVSVASGTPTLLPTISHRQYTVYSCGRTTSNDNAIYMDFCNLFLHYICQADDL